MRKRTMVLVAAAVGFALPALAAAALSPAEIKTTFATGKPFTAKSLGGKTVSITFNADGTALVLQKGAKKGEAGKWHLSDKGYCTQWGKSPERCYTVQKNGKQYDVIDSSGNLASHWAV